MYRCLEPVYNETGEGFSTSINYNSECMNRHESKWIIHSISPPCFSSVVFSFLHFIGFCPLSSLLSFVSITPLLTLQPHHPTVAPPPTPSHLLTQLSDMCQWIAVAAVTSVIREAVFMLSCTGAGRSAVMNGCRHTYTHLNTHTHRHDQLLQKKT